ncbi:MAG: hypothetical protein IJT94_05390, partial [Oscillibacter sp.]|nr:hypothetical protein [Oscillibacter sp.]
CLYWCDALRDGYFDTYMDAEAYFIRALAERGCTVFSFQTLPQAEDLRFYMDRFHYNADVNVEMERCLAEGAYQVTPETFPAVREELRQMTEAFRSRYADYVR